jgi:hypothetical protein
MAGMICPTCLTRMDGTCPRHGGLLCERCQRCYCERREEPLQADVFDTVDMSLYEQDPAFWQALQAVPCRLEGDRIFCLYVPQSEPVAQIRRTISERFLVRQVFLKPTPSVPELPVSAPSLYMACAGRPGAGWLIPVSGPPRPWPEHMNTPGVPITEDWYEIPTPLRVGPDWGDLIRSHPRCRLYTPPFPLAISRAILEADPHSVWMWHGPFRSVAAYISVPTVPVPHPWGNVRVIRWRHAGCVDIRSVEPRPAIVAVCSVTPVTDGASTVLEVGLRRILRRRP